MQYVHTFFKVNSALQHCIISNILQYHIANSFKYIKYTCTCTVHVNVKYVEHYDLEDPYMC